MAGTLKWINYKGKEILFNDRNNLRNNDIIDNVNYAIDFISKLGKKDILYLIDNTNTIITPEVKEVIRKAGKELSPFIKKTAVIGPNAPQKILINLLSRTTGMSIRIFDSLDECKEWLIR